MKCVICDNICNKEELINIKISTGATINKKVFLIEGLTFYACPNCGNLAVDTDQILEQEKNAKTIISEYGTVDTEPPEDKGGFE